MNAEEIYSRQNRKDEKRFMNWLPMALLVIGFLALIFFFIIILKHFSIVEERDSPNMSATGQIGDFVGGVIGTLFALSGTLLIYLSFKRQNRQNRREAFESSFFEMLRLYRENVSELKYTKSNGYNTITSENRKVFRVIFHEFTECYKEVKKFYRFIDDYLVPEYDLKLSSIINRINPRINKKEFAVIDIAYSIVFFGVGDEGERVLHHRFKSKYTNSHIFRLIEFIRLKPKREEIIRFENWHFLKLKKVKELNVLVDELYRYRRNKSIALQILTSEEYEYLIQNNYEKYYGGHQHRLGHYFRHLFQTYKYLHYSKQLSKKKKYFYAKTLRAQLSTYEQALLFVNSISSLGMKWEMTPELENRKSLTEDEQNKRRIENHLITEYNLIKNLPGEKILDLRYKSYYPNIKYESDEN